MEVIDDNLAESMGHVDKARRKLLGFSMIAAGLSVAIAAWLLYRGRSSAKQVQISSDAPGEGKLLANKEFARKAREYAVLDALDPAALTELVALLRKYRPRVYTSKHCPYCLVQTIAMHNLRDNLEIVDCDTESERCRAENVKSLPYWKLSPGHEHVGLLRKRALLQMLKGLQMSEKAPPQ